MLERKCCDLCGFSDEKVFALFSDAYSCPICGYEFDDEALLYLDEFIKKELPDGITNRKISLNCRQSDFIGQVEELGSFQGFFLRAELSQKLQTVARYALRACGTI